MKKKNDTNILKIRRNTKSSISAANVKKLHGFYTSRKKQKSVILNDDCMKVLPYLHDKTIDLVVCSPPYNVDLGKNKYNKNPYDLYRDNKKHNEYTCCLDRT